MTYSVVIRNRNEERFIGHCIQSLVDFLGDKIQVVIVDNESTDNSLRVVNTFDYLDITRLKIDKNDYSPGSSLNYGISICENNVTHPKTCTALIAPNHSFPRMCKRFLAHQISRMFSFTKH